MRAAAVLAVVAACGSAADDGGGYDYAASKGAALYRQLCQSCHGETGEGGIGPQLLDTPRTLDELRATIAMRMPANNPGQCDGACADDVAAFVKDGLTSRALRCDALPPGPRRLRLLTRREYRATVRDLFGTGAPAMSCPCAFRDRCDAADTCQPSACDAQTFVFDPQGRTLASVAVAGTFNNWTPSWPLARDAHGLWVGTFVVGDGQHQYKLVLDGSEWIEDPRAPARAPDGFGGNNSVFALSCAADPVAAIPAESRPAGFPFDSDADSAVVTAQHVEAYLAAARPLADYAAAHAPEDVPTLGRRVFRRPLTADEAAYYGALDRATALHAMLISPHFLYRSEVGEGGRLTGYEIATALAYTFLGTTPDDALLAAAAAGELDDVAGRERWARRLVADPRASAQLGEFALQWIGGREVESVDKRADLFPDFDATTRRALADETRAFAAGAATLDELLTADYTVLDAAAARFYGVTGTGRVAYSDGRRAGVLGHAALLATTAHSDQTSPIRRGLLVRRNLLCEDLPPPPPFAGGVPDVDPNATTRERFAMHTANPVCAGCHRFIDSVGFGFEHFDPVGRWRDTENGQPIDASGDMNDVDHLGTGTTMPYATVPELARAIATSRAAPSCFVRQYLRFSRGLAETLAQRCERLWLEDKFAAAGHDLRELMVQAVLDPAFVERR
jgi:uncharacterized protein DUF1588/uncharacterized protein DUF1592/cbb3-type cytochrome c oxidase subunit III/AMP-activated protein kinase-like protein